jgi:hypothetical protein
MARSKHNCFLLLLFSFYLFIYFLEKKIHSKLFYYLVFIMSCHLKLWKEYTYLF